MPTYIQNGKSLYRIGKAHLIYLLHVIHSAYSVGLTPRASALPTLLTVFTFRIYKIDVK